MEWKNVINVVQILEKKNSKWEGWEKQTVGTVLPEFDCLIPTPGDKWTKKHKQTGDVNLVINLDNKSCDSHVMVYNWFVERWGLTETANWK